MSDDDTVEVLRQAMRGMVAQTIDDGERSAASAGTHMSAGRWTEAAGDLRRADDLLKDAHVVCASATLAKLGLGLADLGRRASDARARVAALLRRVAEERGEP